MWYLWAKYIIISGRRDRSVIYLGQQLSIIWIQLNIWGFRTHQHQRSLVPIVNDFLWLCWPLISRDLWGLKFPDICLTVEEKPQPGKLVQPGLELRPAMWEATMLLLDHSGGLDIIYSSIWCDSIFPSQLHLLWQIMAILLHCNFLRFGVTT